MTRYQGIVISCFVSFFSRWFSWVKLPCWEYLRGKKQGTNSSISNIWKQGPSIWPQRKWVLLTVMQLIPPQVSLLIKPQPSWLFCDNQWKGTQLDQIWIPGSAKPHDNRCVGYLKAPKFREICYAKMGSCINIIQRSWNSHAGLTEPRVHILLDEH